MRSIVFSCLVAVCLSAGAEPRPKVSPSPKTGDKAPEKAPPAPTYQGQPIPAPPPVRKSSLS